MITSRNNKKRARSGGVYIAVLGTSLIVALLGLTALVAQRIQNRIVIAAGDIRQAQLNALTAAELALLTMRSDSNWRTNEPNGSWFTDLDTGAGTSSVQVTDPVDGILSNDAEESVIVEGTGRRGLAEQRVRLLVDARKQPLSSLESAIAVVNNIDLQSDTLRANGLITANQVSASSSFVYGDVEAVTIGGSTFADTTTQIDSAKLPTMPNWSSVFNYYVANGTQINISALPTSMPANLGRNVGIESGSTFWTGSPPNTPTADISQSNNQRRSGTNSLRVQNRTDWQAGAAQRIDSFVKPGQAYFVDIYVMLPILSLTQDFRLSLHTKGTGDASAQSVHHDVSVLNLLSLSWARLSTTFTAPSWTGDLEYAFIKVAGANSGNTSEFYVDDFVIRDTSTGRIMFRRVLGPGINPFGPTNLSQGKTHGIYFIDCGGNRITIDRCRIVGTLLIINPGAGSGIASGPIDWSTVVAGYPALLVDAADPTTANFTIRSTGQVLSESDQNFNFNPTGAASADFGTDSDTNDIYQSVIQGLVAIEGDLMFQGRSLVRGQILVGGNVGNSSGQLEVDYKRDALLNPPPGFLGPYSHLRRPASIQKAVLP